jgi:hypothetical protein
MIRVIRLTGCQPPPPTGKYHLSASSRLWPRRLDTILAAPSIDAPWLAAATRSVGRSEKGAGCGSIACNRSTSRPSNPRKGEDRRATKPVGESPLRSLQAKKKPGQRSQASLSRFLEPGRTRQRLQRHGGEPMTAALLLPLLAAIGWTQAGGGGAPGGGGGGAGAARQRRFGRPRTGQRRARAHRPGRRQSPPEGRQEPPEPRGPRPRRGYP